MISPKTGPEYLSWNFFNASSVKDQDGCPTASIYRDQDWQQNTTLGQNFMSVSRKKAGKYSGNEYAHELSRVSNSRHVTPAQKMMVVHKLQNLNLSFDSSQQISMIKKTAALMKKMVPNPPDFDWSIIESGLNAAQTPLQQINVSKFLTEQLKKNVLPFVKRPQTKVPVPKPVQEPIKKSTGLPPIAAYDPRKPDPLLFILGKKDPRAPPENKESGSINGAKLMNQHPRHILPHTSSAAPI